MAGGYALLPTFEDAVYELARELNRGGNDPASWISRAVGGAAANQKDSDSSASCSTSCRGPQDLSLPAPAAARARVPVALARDIARRVDRNEAKRQMPPGPKVTARAFGEGRRYPIAQKFTP